MSENTEIRATSSRHPFHGFMSWLSVVTGIIVIGSVGYSMYLVKAYLPYIGLVWIVAISTLPGIGVAFLLVAFVRFLMRVDIINISETGTILRNWLGHNDMYHPLGIKEYRNKHEKENKTEVFEVPPLLDLLKNGVINTIELMLGYHVDGSIVYGTWDNLRSFVVAGKSRSGKTVTMVFFIVQALLSGAIVYVCDPHFNKKSGLLKVLEALWPYIHIGRTDVEILECVREFNKEMKARLANTSDMADRPMLIVIDEWSVLLRDLDKVEKDTMVKLVLDCNEAYAGVNGYAMIAGQEWTARESGGSYGAAVRRGFHAVFVHRLDEEYAKFLLTGVNKKSAKTAPNLPTGNAHFVNSEGEIDYLIIPYYGKNKEAIIEVAGMLLSYEQQTQIDYNTPVQPQLSYEQSRQQYAGYIEAPDVVTDTMEALQPKNTPIPESVQPSTVPTNESDIAKYIFRLRKRNIGHRDISYALGWYGPNYKRYQEFCTKHNIPLTETVEQ